MLMVQLIFILSVGWYILTPKLLGANKIWPTKMLNELAWQPFFVKSLHSYLPHTNWVQHVITLVINNVAQNKKKFLWR
jgi:hypothetical protein